MQHNDGKKFGNLTLVRGDKPRTASVVRERVVAVVRSRKRRVVSRNLESVVQGVTDPTQHAIKLMDRLAAHARASYEEAFDAVIEPQIEWLCDRYGREYTHHEPPKAA